MSSQPAYPPATHTSTDRANPIVSVQPQPAAAMIPQEGVQKEQGPAQRLRGGCIPCPVRFATQHNTEKTLTDDVCRTEAFAGSSLFRVVVAKRT